MVNRLSEEELRRFLSSEVADPWIAQSLARAGTLSEADLRAVRDVIRGDRPVYAGRDGDVDLSGLAQSITGTFASPLLQTAAMAFAQGRLGPTTASAFRATAAVVAGTPGDMALIGTGILISSEPGVVLTAGHVARAALPPKAVVFGDSLAASPPIAITDLWYSPYWDVGLLRLDLPPPLKQQIVPIRAMAQRPPEQMLVATIGYPGVTGSGGLFLNLLGCRCFGLGLAMPDPNGVIWKERLDGLALRQPVVGHDCSTEQGYSGGPVIDVATGLLVGIQVNGQRNLGGFNLNLALAVETLSGIAEVAQFLAVPSPTGAAPAHPPASRRAAPVLRRQGTPRILAAQQDWPDIRDRRYTARLAPLPAQFIEGEPRDDEIRDQGGTAHCVGYALAATIDRQLRRSGIDGTHVSPRMLYEFAKIHDDLPGEGYDGTTLRGAIKGFFHNGVGPYRGDHEQAALWSERDLRVRSGDAIHAGSYLRLARETDDFHSALVESGCILASARIHEGWAQPERNRKPWRGRIAPKRPLTGAHAFVIIGYNAQGFVILNSWGADWGRWNGLPGTALWTYDDFDETLLDAWVVRLAVSAPRFAKRLLQRRREGAGGPSGGLRRSDLAGSFLRLSEGGLAAEGSWGFPPRTFDETRRKIRAGRRGGLRHLLLVFHDGLVSEDEIERRSGMLVQAAGDDVMAVSVDWRTALGLALAPCATAFAGDDDPDEGADRRDRRIARSLAPVVAPLWRNAISDAESAVAPDGDVWSILDPIVESAVDGAQAALTLSVAADGLGAQLMRAWFVATASRRKAPMVLANLFLFTPCLSPDEWHCIFEPRLAGIARDLQIRRALQWGIDPRREPSDRVGPYRGPSALLVGEALGQRFLGDLATLGEGERLPNHRVVEGDALGNGFLGRPDVIRQILDSIRTTEPSETIGSRP